MCIVQIFIIINKFPYLHYTHTTITATIHCMPLLHLCISTHSSDNNMYYVAPEPNTTYSMTLTNNYTTQ